MVRNVKIGEIIREDETIWPIIDPLFYLKDGKTYTKLHKVVNLANGLNTLFEGRFTNLQQAVAAVQVPLLAPKN